MNHRISAFIGKIASLQDDVQMLEDELFEYKQDLEGDLCAVDDREKCGAVGADMQKRIDALNAAILRLDYATDNLNAAARCLTK